MKLYDECFDGVAKILNTFPVTKLEIKSVSEWKNSDKNQIVFQSDTAYELGGGTLPAVSSVAFTDKSDYVRDDEILLILPEVIKPVQKLKVNYLGGHNPRLHTDETLLALSISASTNENAAAALAQLKNLRNTEFHSTVMLAQVDESLLKRLGVRVTCDPNMKK